MKNDSLEIEYKSKSGESESMSYQIQTAMEWYSAVTNINTYSIYVILESCINAEDLWDIIESSHYIYIKYSDGRVEEICGYKLSRIIKRFINPGSISRTSVMCIELVKEVV